MAIITIDRTKGIYNLVFSIAFVLTIIGIFIQLAAVILLFISRNISREKELITQKYLNVQKNYYEYLEQREKETKKFRHDLRSHMQMLSMLAQKKEYVEFDKYLNAINTKIDSFGNSIRLGNGIVDAIVNKCYSEALQNDIKMEVNGIFPNDCEIEAYDLCTIFSNVLSNAFEAAVKTAEKVITLDCRYTDENIIIVIKNSFVNIGQFNNNNIKTDKSDLNYHGFGLENIHDCIEKNNGVFNIEIENDIFGITILLNY